MDPVGPWYTSYNRLASGSAAGTFQASSSGTSSDFVTHHIASAATQAVPPVTTSQLLLQAAHTTTTLAGQPSPFNPGGFLSPPPPVSYDVFSPLFHHTNPKQAHYVTLHRQELAQAQTGTKQNSAAADIDVSALGDNYSPSHQANFLQHQTTATCPTASTLAWTHQSNSQLPSPFGILPHESVPSSPGPPPPSTKSSSAYDNSSFNAHYAGTPRTINNINTQISSTIATGADLNYSEKKNTRSPSPVVSVKSAVGSAQNSTGQTFFQQTSYSSESLANNYSTNNNQSSAKVQAPLQHQQSCIVSTLSNAPSKEYRIPQPTLRTTAPTTIYLNATAKSASCPIQEKQPRSFASPPSKTPSSTQQGIQTKAQAKIYPEISSHNAEHKRTEQHENSQSSPISFSIMDSRNYANNPATNCNNTSNKIASGQRTLNNNLQHNQQQFHILNQQSTRFESTTTPYRHYSTGSTSDSEYHHPGRSKSATSTDSAYSSNTSTQNGPDCGVVVPRRPSPLQAHSQASPLGHVPSPAYPMYNSPMATISSPSPLQQDNNGNNGCSSGTLYKTRVQQQMTPPSPLDVTVPRPSSQGQVAYSSVITRALGSTENNKTTYNTESRTYERQEFAQTQKQQVCWENDNRQTNAPRDCAVTTYGTNTEINTLLTPQQQAQRVVSERQQTYFDSHQVTLQDLSSCRGDPMSIVKNLQTLQQGSCQQQQPVAPSVGNEQLKQTEERRKPESPTKKKKSLEKGTHGSLNELAGAAVMTEYLSRIPPPAHLNTNQQQQNGYFDFERWNLPPPPSKMFPSSTGAFGTQTTLHHSNNFVGNPAHQHQPLMVSHHHAAAAAPPLTYFPAFHISPSHHHAHDFQSCVESTPIVAFGDEDDDDECRNSSFDQQVRDDKPKVIVPDIEEELGFLQQNQPMAANRANNEVKIKGKDPNSGFMTSYLKFLQGERDPSPEPALRGGRKATWNRSKPYIPPEPSKSLDGSMNGTKSQDKSKEMPQIDYANDPRYFPLPKERKNKNFDSSDGGFSSDDDFPFGIKKTEKKINAGAVNVVGTSDVVKTEPKPRKGRPIKPGGPTDRKRKAAAAAAAAGAEGASVTKASKKSGVEPLTLPPRRETSRRKAKEKSSVKKLLDQQQGIDYFDNDEELGDSDSDPAWTPAAKLAGDEEEKRKKRGRPVISKRSRKVMDEEGYSSGDMPFPKKSGRKKHDMNSKHSNNTKLSCKIDEKLLAAVGDDAIDISPFERSMDDSDDGSGEFVVIKSDLDKEFPPLWRIDGKTLLQKYEPFKSKGKTLYRNISTYSGWAPQNRHIYQQVPVKFWQQDKLETIVEFLRDEMIIDDSECIDKSMKETEKYQDNFEVYIQTLISQALDSNFLTEIFQEQDDYFLSNVKTVDEVTEERKRRLLSTTTWRPNVVTAISTWPCLNVLKDLPPSEYKGKLCAGCQQDKINTRVLLYGQPYNGTTLEGSPPDPRVLQEKDFLFCRICQAKVALYNKVAHQKYLMFLECARRVGDKRISDPHKDTTIILNELLADEAWLNQLFKEVRSIWAEIDSIQHQAKIKMAAASGSQENTSKSSSETNKDASATSNSQVSTQNINIDPQSLSRNINANKVTS